MQNILLFLVFLLISNFTIAQTRYLKITGKVVDTSGKPVVNANIIDNTSKYGSITDSSGFFDFDVNTKINKLLISHLGYQTSTFDIDKNIYKNDSCSFLITLIKKNIQLDEVEIFGNNTEIAYKNKNVWVLDYELTKNGIYLITNKSGFGKKNLIFLNYSGDTITYKIIKNRINKIYKDIFDNILLFSSDSVFQVFFNNNDIKLIYPNSVEKINSRFLSVIGNTKMFFMQQYYTDFNQTISYYYINKFTKEKKLLIRISNEEAAQANKNYFYSKLRQKTNSLKKMGEFNNPEALEEVRREIDDDLFFKLILSKPIYDPIKIVGNEIIIFDFEDNKILFFDSNLKLQKTVYINFHKTKYWDNKIYIDLSLNNCYAKFITKI